MMQETSKVTKKSTVVKSNNLVNTITSFKLQEYRLFNSIISCLPSFDDIDFSKKQSVSLHIKDLAGFFNIKSNNLYSCIEEAGNKLQTTLVKWYEGDEKCSVQLISKMKYSGGCIYAEIHEDILSQLFNLKKIGNYTIYRLLEVKDFHSVQAFRLYKLLIQFEKFKRRKFEINELREKLGIKNKYKTIANLEYNCIKPAITEIEKKTAYKIKYKKIKTGVRISHIEISFSKRKIEQKKLRNVADVHSNYSLEATRRWDEMNEEDKNSFGAGAMAKLKFISEYIEIKNSGD